MNIKITLKKKIKKKKRKMKSQKMKKKMRRTRKKPLRNLQRKRYIYNSVYFLGFCPDAGLNSSDCEGCYYSFLMF